MTIYLEYNTYRCVYLMALALDLSLPLSVRGLLAETQGQYREAVEYHGLASKLPYCFETVSCVLHTKRNLYK